MYVCLLVQVALIPMIKNVRNTFLGKLNRTMNILFIIGELYSIYFHFIRKNNREATREKEIFISDMKIYY